MIEGQNGAWVFIKLKLLGKGGIFSIACGRIQIPYFEKGSYKFILDFFQKYYT